MEEFWFNFNPIDKNIDIEFKNVNYYFINVFIHMLSISKLVDLKDSFEKRSNNSSEPFILDIEYENCSIYAYDDYVLFKLYHGEFENSYSIETDFFSNVLNAYIEEYEKMMNEEVGLSK